MNSAWQRLWDLLLADDVFETPSRTTREQEPAEGTRDTPRLRPVSWVCHHMSHGRTGDLALFREAKAA